MESANEMLRDTLRHGELVVCVRELRSAVDQGLGRVQGRRS